MTAILTSRGLTGLLGTGMVCLLLVGLAVFS